MKRFTCDRCNVEWLQDDKAIGTGYALMGDRKICYQCCAVADRLYMIENGHARLYVTSHFGRHTVTNWPGTLKIDVIDYRTSMNNFRAERLDVWFVGPDQKIWHGVNVGDNQILRCKRTKRKAI